MFRIQIFEYGYKYNKMEDQLTIHLVTKMRLNYCFHHQMYIPQPFNLISQRFWISLILLWI
jgi:hypothetical protein